MTEISIGDQYGDFKVIGHKKQRGKIMYWVCVCPEDHTAILSYRSLFGKPPLSWCRTCLKNLYFTGLIRCTKCQAIKRINEFGSRGHGKFKLICKLCRRTADSSPSGSKRKQLYGLRARRKSKTNALVAYSGQNPTCSCHGCNEHRWEFLTIDHIDGNGAAHRRSLSSTRKVSGREFYVWLRKNNYPPGFRVLCMNCNFSLGAYGYCPHENNKID